MNNLEAIMETAIAKATADKVIKSKKQERILDDSNRKCKEIIDKLDFLSKYGFSLAIKLNYCRNYFSKDWYGFNAYAVIMKHNGRHFAYLYPLVDDAKNDFYSYQIENTLSYYTYESCVKAIAKMIR